MNPRVNSSTYMQSAKINVFEAQKEIQRISIFFPPMLTDRIVYWSMPDCLVIACETLFLYYQSVE